MIDFTSSLYLGLRHPSSSLPAWPRLTTGVPAVLAEPRATRALAQQLAGLLGAERALIMPSTLHLFFDLFRKGLPSSVFFCDEALYPVARWAVEHAALSGSPHRRIPHLARGIDLQWLRRHTPHGYRAVIVSDGFCHGCGQPAPLRRYQQWAQSLGGLVVIDDTQALGLLGTGPSDAHPFGTGGGGSLLHQALSGGPIIVGASLAKAFGVPLAVLSGPKPVLEGLAAHSDVRVHTSPVCAPLVAAARAAIDHSARCGSQLRARLARHIARFRCSVARLGWTELGKPFPVQSLAMPDAATAQQLQRALAARGIRALVTVPGCSAGPALTFILRADHSEQQLSAAIHALRACVPRRPT